MESGLRMFENGVLRRVFGPKRDVVTGEWSRLRNEKLNPLNKKRRLLYLKTQFVPRSKHFSSQL